MKRILSLFIVFMMFTGVAIAASINGDFEGNPIVKVKSNGQEITPDEVPAIIYKGRTMVPISILDKLGAEVEWDRKTYSVEVNLPEPEPIVTEYEYDIVEQAKQMRQYGVDFISFNSNGDTYNITYFYKNTVEDLESKNDYFNAILYNSTFTNAIMGEISYSDGSFFSYPIDVARDFYAGKITPDEFAAHYQMHRPSSSRQSTDNRTNNRQPETQKSTSSSEDARILICKQIDSNYADEIERAKRNYNPFSGKDNYLVSQLESLYQEQKQKFGCQ